MLQAFEEEDIFLATSVTKKLDHNSSWLDREWNISVRTGLHCAPSIHSIIGTKGRGTVRIGIGYCTTCEEIDYLIDALKRFVEEKGCI